jgi:hypothetical protein
MSQEEVRRYAHEIETEWKKSVRAILSVSDLLQEAFGELDNADWRDLINQIGFSPSWVSKMKKISECGRFKTVKIRNRLPASYTLIWEYASLTEREWQGILAIKTHPMPVSREATHSSFQKGLIEWRGENPHPDHKPDIGIRLQKGLFCGFTVPDDIDDEIALEIKHLIDKIESKLYHLGVNIHYADAPTPLKANLVIRKKELADKLETKWVAHIHKHNQSHGRNENVEDIQKLEDTLWQHRYFEENGKYPYEPTRPQSVENKAHPFFVGKYPSETIYKNLKTTHQIDKKNSQNYGEGLPISSWTPITEWPEFAEAKYIYWTLEYCRAITSKQRGHWKRKLANHSRWKSGKDKRTAEKYLQMIEKL